ncbi:tannase/feruloyl esterase family alpha/beta hydrolase [Sphingosinithalassobacter sp. CS137]|uniref:tannase/feruloyl esterase family alpha/beta hydrolase n=1 Tax=Sphingosinithalassobacter sp. CS137 TaxID=2762748 RepID=UPI0021D00576|nr:tannase/feruloyl esterase family alpha/beta hydrolase [Sphingosinithalassobacter sp. CS137]
MFFGMMTAAACAALAGQHPDGVVVSDATLVQPAPTWMPVTQSFYRPLPVQVPLCRVEGAIEGNIGFELWLPVEWNGRLLGAGVGGDAGIYNYLDMSRRVGEGFATVTTDSGHKATQARWMADTKARVDYEHRAVHLTAVAAKRLAERYYGRAPDRSYFTGCSGGGRQALKEMQTYPGDYDGVLAGAPGPYMPLQSVRMLWFALQQARQPEAALSDDDWSLYEHRVTETCDASDGVRDGIIENPMACSFDTATLLCRPGQTEGCLTAPRLAMLNAIIAPMPDESGMPMDGGLFPGVRTRPGPPSPLLRAMWADGVYDDPNWDAETFRRTADLAAANRMMPELRADRVSIGSFLARGGKAILYQGWADPSTNAGPTIDYYESLVHAQGGLDRLDDSVRLFLVPGMYHCRGGPGADMFGGSGHMSWPGDRSRDMLWALIDWVERDEAPQRVTATKIVDGTGAFSRALCPFPQSARYDGQGPTDSASSYSCVADPLLAQSLADAGD